MLAVCLRNFDLKLGFFKQLTDPVLFSSVILQDTVIFIIAYFMTCFLGHLTFIKKTNFRNFLSIIHQTRHWFSRIIVIKSGWAFFIFKRTKYGCYLVKPHCIDNFYCAVSTAKRPFLCWQLNMMTILFSRRHDDHFVIGLPTQYTYHFTGYRINNEIWWSFDYLVQKYIMAILFCCII